MNEERISELAAGDAALLDLGAILGQNLAFSLVAGRCSAAAAESLRRLREEKLYKRCAEKWDEFCPKYLKISRVEADRTIKLWEEFGPAYFELSQLTRVSPQTFRAIAPAIQDGALRYNGEAIALNAENSRKVAAAVADLRRSLPKRSPDMDLNRRIAKLEKTCAAVIAEFERISSDPGIGAVRMLFQSALTSARAELGRVAKENGLA
jgi:hypothetical protein